MYSTPLLAAVLAPWLATLVALLAVRSPAAVPDRTLPGTAVPPQRVQSAAPAPEALAAPRWVTLGQLRGAPVESTLDRARDAAAPPLGQSRDLVLDLDRGAVRGLLLETDGHLRRLDLVEGAWAAGSGCLQLPLGRSSLHLLPTFDPRSLPPPLRSAGRAPQGATRPARLGCLPARDLLGSTLHSGEGPFGPVVELVFDAELRTLHWLLVRPFPGQTPRGPLQVVPWGRVDSAFRDPQSRRRLQFLCDGELRRLASAPTVDLGQPRALEDPELPLRVERHFAATQAPPRRALGR
jgi:hypothetical protein